jgi:hypothetical protein
MNWIYLTQDSDMWWAVMNAVVNPHVTRTYNAVNLLTSEVLISHAGLCFMEIVTLVVNM